MLDLLWRCALVGAGATALMDLWAIVLNRVAGIPLPNWGLVGRWFAHLPRGTVFHDDITRAEPVANEVAIGWVAHYAVGVLYGVLVVALAGVGWLARPTLWPALIVGWVTIGAGWFLLQPGMGGGWASSRRANAWQIRGLNVAAHTVFGTGLWATARLMA